MEYWLKFDCDCDEFQSQPWNIEVCKGGGNFDSLPIKCSFELAFMAIIFQIRFSLGGE